MATNNKSDDPPTDDPPTEAQLEQWAANRALADRQLTEPPILIGGCGRSGTTLLLAIISAHPQVLAIAPETNIFCPSGYGHRVDTGLPIEMDDRFDRHLGPIQPPNTFDRWCEKTPRNVLFFERIAEHFNGRVRFLHIIRDGRDVVLSRHPVDRSKYWVSIERWVNDVSAGMAAMNHPTVGPLVHTVRYEELITDNDRVVRGVCAFLGLPFGDAMRDWHEHATVRENAAWPDGVKPLFAESIGKWRKPENADRAAELMAHPDAVRLLAKLGYLSDD